MAAPWRTVLVLGVSVGATLGMAGCADVQGNAARVSLQGGTFEPGAVTIRAGGVVVFHVVHGTHTVDFVETGGVSMPVSGELQHGERHVVQFNIPGVYHYFCTHFSHRVGVLREGMTGTVTVE